MAQPLERLQAAVVVQGLADPVGVQETILVDRGLGPGKGGRGNGQLGGPLDCELDVFRRWPHASGQHHLEGLPGLELQRKEKKEKGCQKRKEKNSLFLLLFVLFVLFLFFLFLFLQNLV